jgi:ParB family transcriptional regulator, chromosome partitioning protein
MLEFGKDKLESISIELIVRNPRQPRQSFDEKELAQLAESLDTHGLVQPIVLRKLPNCSYEIIAGERRWRAAQMICWQSIPAIVKSIQSIEAFTLSLIENIQRQKLDPWDEACAINEVKHQLNLNETQLAKQLSKTRNYITKSLKPLKLCYPVQQLMRDNPNFFSKGHAVALSSLCETDQAYVANRMLNGMWSVRQTEKAVKKLKSEMQTDAPSIDPNVKRVERLLSEHLGCKVSLSFNQQSGDVSWSAKGTVEEFQGQLAKMGLVKEIALNI